MADEQVDGQEEGKKGGLIKIVLLVVGIVFVVMLTIGLTLYFRKLVFEIYFFYS